MTPSAATGSGGGCPFNGRFVEPLIDARIALAAPVARAMHPFRPHGIPMIHYLRDRLHRGALLVVDVDAPLWHSGLSWCAAWTAGGMVERPPPPAGGPATAWPLAVATRGSACDAPCGQGPREVLMSSPRRARVWDIFLSLLS